VTRDRRGERNLFFAAEHRFRERQALLDAEIATTRLAAPLPRAAKAEAAEQIRTEHVGEDVLEVREDIAAAELNRTLDAGVTESIVKAALVLVAEDGIRLAGLFETVTRVRALVAVGVELESEALVRLPDVAGVGPFGDPKNVVVVAFAAHRFKPGADR
jgi:hypothetical protein